MIRTLRRRHSSPMRISLPPLPIISAEKWAQRSVAKSSENCDSITIGTPCQLLSPREQSQADLSSPCAPSELCSNIASPPRISKRSPSKTRSLRYSCDAISRTPSRRSKSFSVPTSSLLPLHSAARQFLSNLNHNKSFIAALAKEGDDGDGCERKQQKHREKGGKPSVEEPLDRRQRKDSFALRSEGRRLRRRLMLGYAASRLREESERMEMMKEEKRCTLAWSPSNAVNLAAQEKEIRRRYAYEWKKKKREDVRRRIDNDFLEIQSRIAKWEATVASPPSSRPVSPRSEC